MMMRKRIMRKILRFIVERKYKTMIVKLEKISYRLRKTKKCRAEERSRDIIEICI